MTIRLQEPVVTAVIARLQTQLPAIIADINSSITDGYLLPTDTSRILDYIPPVADMYTMPVIGISDGEMHFEDDTGWGATGVFDLSIVVFIQNADQRALAWQLRRYAQALVQALRTPTNAIGEGWGVVIKGIRPGPTLGRDENPRQWMSTVAVTITVKSEQDL